MLCGDETGYSSGLRFSTRRQQVSTGSARSRFRPSKRRGFLDEEGSGGGTLEGSPHPSPEHRAPIKGGVTASGGDGGGATSSGLRDLSMPSLARLSGAPPASLSALGSAPPAEIPGRRCLRRLLGRGSHRGADMGTRGGQGGDVSAYGAPPPDAARLHGDGEHGEVWFYGSPPNFSLTKSSVLKPAPGRISWNTVPLTTRTSSVDSPPQTR